MKVLIIDDHILFLEGLKTLLKQHFSEAHILVSHSVNDANELIKEHHDLDIVLMDLRMPNGGAPQMLSDLKKSQSLVPTLVISASESSPDVQLVMTCGAGGYIPKTSTASELVSAINTVLSGNIFLPEKWHQRLIQQNNLVVDDGGNEISISARLQDVLMLIEKGYPTKEISKLLSISEHTVYGYVKELFRKFEVNNRTELVQSAKSLNLFGFK